MAQLVVRHLDEAVKAGLRRRAMRAGRSMEEEVRLILREAVRDETLPTTPLGKRLRALFADIGLDEEIAELRGQPARPASFE